MSPEYLNELADLADPDQLWKLPFMDHIKLPPEKRKQLDAGVALRRYASHIQQLADLRHRGRSLLITPLSASGSAITDVAPPAKHKRLLEQRATLGEHNGK